MSLKLNVQEWESTMKSLYTQFCISEFQRARQRTMEDVQELIQQMSVSEEMIINTHIA